MVRVALHLALHVLVPLALARLWWRERWLRAFGVLLATNLVDLDHLLATPIFASDRCSIAVHPLHSGVAMAVYAGALAFGPTRLVAVGLLAHLALDGIDCLCM